LFLIVNIYKEETRRIRLYILVIKKTLFELGRHYRYGFGGKNKKSIIVDKPAGWSSRHGKRPKCLCPQNVKNQTTLAFGFRKMFIDQ